jgi:2-(1,2-epoxy-1,2-dihydrophenyl)acetyl-CoA isomerase
MNEEPPIRIEGAGGIVTITLNRPAALNALDHPMALALHEAIAGVADMADARAVILRGAGRSFCGGGDVAAMHAHRDDLPGFIGQMIDAFHASVMALNRLRLPVIASVQGAVAGGGISLALACDLVLAARGTRFVVAYPQLGAPADGGLTFRLTQRLGAVRALETMLVHGTIDAPQAQALGLINAVVDSDSADDEALRWAQQLAASAPQSVAEIKQLVASQSHDDLQAHLARERAAFVRCAATADFAQRVEAFVRRPGRSDRPAGGKQEGAAP